MALSDNGTGENSPHSSAAVDPVLYKKEVESDRTKKNEYMRTNVESPIPDKTKFTELLYFPPDPAYRVQARLEPFADKTQKIIVRMSDGSEEVYSKYAHAVFSLQDEACRLLIVQATDGTHSILFRDATSSKETYGGGRYLDLEADALTGTQTVIDFNTAYNPYCAYNPSYACPIPPAENTLPVAVKAGERYQEHD